MIKPKKRFNDRTDYKTRAGIEKALVRASQECMDIKLAWWFQNITWVLVTQWGMDEKEAALYVAKYRPTESAYCANS